MSSNWALSLQQVSKCYHLFERPQDRLKQFLFGRWKRYEKSFWAVQDVTINVDHGEVIGIIGRNGAGKSTLLQLICGTLTPTSGTVAVNGRVAALLELGAGFNPDFTGKENIFLNAAILGLSQKEIEERYEEIVEFSGIREFIDQPVKTYSSGMYVRLAFSVAINVDPDILIIDEALSVGDGIFARKSFDKIMAMKEAGKTILFCSHSMYQIESICNRVIWLEKGRVREIGPPPPIVSRYEISLASSKESEPQSLHTGNHGGDTDLPRIRSIILSADGIQGRELAVRSRKSNLLIEMTYDAPSHLPTPTIAIGITSSDGRTVCSAGNLNDQVFSPRDEDGKVRIKLEFPAIPLLKGEYTISAFLLCERGLHIYEQALDVGKLYVSQHDLEQGLVSIPHRWIKTLETVES
ncbi:ABC transporter ATP-binding protein [Chitinimonas lacunae]|uniref:ABC transporter ATP-binding protein n=1 Tax=Chitinimonas lacunae TaxID=1963018 RepID=A0ABV8MVM2_9NEIS